MNLLGIGVDSEQISEFTSIAASAAPADARLIRRIYTSAETAYCFSRPNPAQHLAARFAGKEAILKALMSSGLCNTIPLRDIEISSLSNGAPIATVQGSFPKNMRIHLSLSHSTGQALAFAVVTLETEAVKIAPISRQRTKAIGNENRDSFRKRSRVGSRFLNKTTLNQVTASPPLKLPENTSLASGLRARKHK